MADRRRINGPVGITIPPIFIDEQDEVQDVSPKGRLRPSQAIRKMCKDQLNGLQDTEAKN